MKKVTIIGAGLVGSLWAVLLRQKNFEVSLYEKRQDPRHHLLENGRSINLVITSRGLYGLEKAGLLNKVLPLAVPVYGRMIHPLAGENIFQAYGQSHEHNLSISRLELNKFLINEAERAGVKIYFGHELSDIDCQNKKLHFSVGSSSADFSYNILFGADGSGSVLRRKLASQFKFEDKTDWLEADYKELSLPLDTEGHPQLDTKALHIWPRGGHMMMALANHNGSFTVTLYLPPKARAQSPGFDQIKSAADVKKLFAGEFPDAISLMPDYVNEFLQHPQGNLGTVRCSQWVFNDSIALMGDAAHAIVPFFGQGMNCGFEDCTELLRLLEAHQNQWSQVLTEYEALRKPNARAIADMALENFEEMRDRVGDSEFLLRKKVENLLEQKFPHQFKSRYGLITYTRVPYSIAQRAGLVQNEIIEELLGPSRSLEKIPWEKAKSLIREKWRPVLGTAADLI